VAEIKHATDETFPELVLQNDKPVIVDFWAAWCGPCKMVAPEMEKLAAKYDGVVDIVKVDVDANPGLSQAFGRSRRACPAIAPRSSSSRSSGSRRWRPRRHRRHRRPDASSGPDQARAPANAPRPRSSTGVAACPPPRC
jgi:thioredoxin